MKRKISVVFTGLLLAGASYGSPGDFAFLDEENSSPALTAVNWAQPPAACVEEIVPTKPNRPCLDLTRVDDPRKDFPSLPGQELDYWQKAKRPLQYCRALEILRREKARPGSFSPAIVEISWMQAEAVADSDQKIAAVYEASRTHQVPAQVLAGALYQESIYTELGIAEDGANYSCGVGQINLIEWCNWASLQSPQKKRAMGWPESVGACGELKPILLKPFYDIAITRLNGVPEYKLNKSHFQNIRFEDVVRGFPDAGTETQQLRFQAAKSFIENCSDPRNGIVAKANELANLYRIFVPKGLKESQQYGSGEKYNRACREQGFQGAYPFHMGWLLAVGSYNAGPRAIDSLAYFNRFTSAQVKEKDTWKSITPAEVIYSLYWSGAYNAQTDQIHFTTIGGNPTSWNWFKPCVLQRHLARVIQHGTVAGVPNLVDTLEGSNPCARSTFDKDGKLVKSGVPLFRQKSPGQKPLE